MDKSFVSNDYIGKTQLGYTCCIRVSFAAEMTNSEVMKLFPGLAKMLAKKERAS